VINIFVLFDAHLSTLNHDSGSLITHVTVVRCTEYRDNNGKGLLTTPSVHFVPTDLNLMSSNDRDVVVLLQNFLYRFHTVVP